MALWNEPPSKQIWIVYGLSVFGHIALLFAGRDLGIGALQDLLRAFALGAIAVLLGGDGPYALGKSRSWLAISCIVPIDAYGITIRNEIGGRSRGFADTAPDH